MHAFEVNQVNCKCSASFFCELAKKRKSFIRGEGNCRKRPNPTQCPESEGFSGTPGNASATLRKRVSYASQLPTSAGNKISRGEHHAIGLASIHFGNATNNKHDDQRRFGSLDTNSVLRWRRLAGYICNSLVMRTRVQGASMRLIGVT